MVRVKICGLREPEHARAVACLGADLLGVVFAPSPRRVSLKRGEEIADAVREGFAGAGGRRINGASMPSDSGTGVPPVRTGQRPLPTGTRCSQSGIDAPGFSLGLGSLPQAEAWGIGLQDRLGRPLLVGVFVNQPVEEVRRIAVACGLDYVQLHGDESPDYCRSLGLPFIKAFRVAAKDGEEDIARRMEAYLAVYPEAIFLLDAHVEGIYGGTGRSWDWGRAARLALRHPVLAAGGLTPENVAGAVQAIYPWGVDVSSGVETDGMKDVAKIKAFIEAVRNAGGS